MLIIAQVAVAGNFAMTWGAAPYTWTASSLGPNTYTLTDQYGFQAQVRFTVTQANGLSVGAFPDDLLTDGGGNTFGTQTSIWQVWNPNLTGGSIGGSTNVGRMEFLNGAAALPVDGLSFRVSDIDAVDNNTNPPTNDRCDHLTFTGNVGNPTITAVTGTPTFRIGPGAGSGASPALAANQVQCIFNTSTATNSPTSNGDNNGTALLAFPNGTSTAVVNYDESVHNVYNNFTFNAAARGVGIWAAPSFVVNNTITLDKQTTSTGFTAVGNVIAYTYVVTNNGPLPLLSTQNVVIQDNKIATVTCPAIPAAGIVAGDTLTCTGSYTIVAADVTANLVTNIATAGVGVGAQTFATRLQSNSDTVTVRRFATLTLVKTVTNDNGGTATTATFTLAAAGLTNISGVSGSAAVTNVSVQPGTYALSETNVFGYTASNWSCSAGTLTGASLVLTSGQNATCTINNNDIAPRLTLMKTVTNDNGGTATTTSVTLSAAGPTNISGVSGAATVTNAAVNAGTYTLAETALANYTAGAWSCTAGTLTGSSLVLTVGQTATCTINNNDIGPVLTLVKTVTNDNGGSATTANFTLSAAGPVTISGISGSVTVTAATVSAGTYALSETNLVGYAAGSWSCTSGSLSGSNLTLALGQNATCTINNNDVAPILTLVKTVTDTSGGPSTVSSFTLTATGPTTITGLTGAVSVTAAPVSAGSYTLSEAGPSGYTAENWSCTSGTLTGANLVLSVGQTSTCTINNIKLPTITIRKISNGGTGGFNFTGSNGIPAQTITTTTVGATFSGSASPLTAHDTITAMTETMPATFWQIETTACTGMGTGGTATLAGNVLTLNALATAAGRNIICTFTNLRRPTVTVQKITTGAIGGAFSFANTNLTGSIANITTTATNTATPASPTRFIASATGTAVTITETSPLTFVAVGVTCSDANSTVSGNVNPVATSSSGALTIPAGAVQIGADINCVFTNAQATPQLVVIKTASVPSVAAAGAPVTYTIAVSNSGNTTLSNIAVTDPLGTVLCPSSGAATVTTLAAGATENCSMSYSVPQAVFDSNGGGDGDLDNTATASATYNSAPVTANGLASVGLVLTPMLSIEKIPDRTTPATVGVTIGYKYRVTNSGNVTMNNVTINDAHVGFGTPPVPGNEAIFSDVAPTGNSTDAAINASWDALAPGDVIEFTSNYVVVQADIDNLQ